MKKTLTLIIAVVMSTLTYAQFTKGTMMIGGSFSATFNSNKVTNGSTTTTTGNTNSISFFPQGGYFIIDNLAVGAGIDLNTTTVKASSGGNKTTVSSSSFAPFGRYYFQKFYGQLAFSVGSGATKFTSGGTTTENSITTSGWSLLAGYAYLLNDHVAVEPQLGYGATSDKGGGSTLTNSGLFIRIGLQIYLSKK